MDGQGNARGFHPGEHRLIERIVDLQIGPVRLLEPHADGLANLHADGPVGDVQLDLCDRLGGEVGLRESLVLVARPRHVSDPAVQVRVVLREAHERIVPPAAADVGDLHVVLGEPLQHQRVHACVMCVRVDYRRVRVQRNGGYLGDVRGRLGGRRCGCRCGRCVDLGGILRVAITCKHKDHRGRRQNASAIQLAHRPPLLARMVRCGLAPIVRGTTSWRWCRPGFPG